MSRGKLIVVEGPDGVGKTTLSLQLVAALNQRVAERWECFSFPGRVERTLGHLVYRVHHDPIEVVGRAVSPEAIQVLHLAAHADAIKQDILPKLYDGTSIVLDRYWWSMYVYGIVNKASSRLLNKLVEAEQDAWADVTPHHCFLIETERPLGTVTLSLEQWQELKRRYHQLEGDESGRYPTMIVHNADGQAEQALEAMLNLIP